VTQEPDELRAVREVLERRDQPRDEEEAATFKRMGQTVTINREHRGMTREELAPKCEMTATELERIERGEVNERWGDLGRVAKGLGMPLSALLGEYEERAPGRGDEDQAST